MTDNFEELNNLDHEEITEDFSDSPFADRDNDPEPDDFSGATYLEGTEGSGNER